MKKIAIIVLFLFIIPSVYSLASYQDRYPDIDNTQPANIDFNDGWNNGGASIDNGDGYFQNLYTYNFSALYINDPVVLNGTQTMLATDLVPITDGTINLGNSTNTFNKIYVRGEPITSNTSSGSGLVIYGDGGIRFQNSTGALKWIIGTTTDATQLRVYSVDYGANLVTWNPFSGTMTTNKGVFSSTASNALDAKNGGIWTQVISLFQGSVVASSMDAFGSDMYYQSLNGFNFNIRPDYASDAYFRAIYRDSTGYHNAIEYQNKLSGVTNMWLMKGTGNIAIGSQTPSSKLDIDSNSNTHALKLRGTDASNEIINLYAGSNGEGIISLTEGTDTAKFLDIRTEDDQYGLIIRESDGTGTATYANMYVTDATDDYLTIGVNTATDADALTVTASNKVGIGTNTPSTTLHVDGGAILGYDGDFGNPMIEIPTTTSLGSSIIRFYDIDTSSFSKSLSYDGLSDDRFEFDAEMAQNGCRSGFTRTGMGCIQTFEYGTGTLEAASDACYDGFGGRLPFAAEWINAVNNHVLSQETDDAEWLAEGYFSSGTAHTGLYLNAAVGTNYDDVRSDFAASGSRAYRCFIPFGGGN